MKILHINGTSEGGTFNLVYDLHKALIKKKSNQISIYRKNRYKKFTLSKKFFFQFLLKNC